MPTLDCVTRNFASVVSDCGNDAGVVAVKYKKTSEVDFTTINGAIATYFDTANFNLKVPLPLVGVGNTHSLLEPSNQDSVVTSSKAAAQIDFNVEINGLMFKNTLNTKQIDEIKKLGSVIAYCLLSNGQVIACGIEYNVSSGKLRAPIRMPLKVAGVNFTSETLGNETGLNTTLSFAGVQEQQFLICNFSWDALN